MRKVRVGIIGAGWVVRNRHLPALRCIPGVECRVICSSGSDNARTVAAQFGITEVAESWQQVCDSSGLDAVIVATPPNLHCAATVRALQAGKHVLCQGRMARNLSEALDMVRAARSSDLVTALYPPLPGLKGDRVMRRLLHDGFVGDVREVRVTGMAPAHNKPGDDWKRDPEIMGVNAMMLGMWAEVLQRWVGPAIRLCAIAKARGGTQVPDSVLVAAELACGANATYHLANSACFLPGHSIEIYGSRGALVYRLFTEEILGATGSGKSLEAVPISPSEERTQSTDLEFIGAIQEGKPVSPDFEEGLGYMEFCEAVALSSLTGSAVKLPLDRPAMRTWHKPREDFVV